VATQPLECGLISLLGGDKKARIAARYGGLDGRGGATLQAAGAEFGIAAAARTPGKPAPFLMDGAPPARRILSLGAVGAEVRKTAPGVAERRRRLRVSGESSEASPGNEPRDVLGELEAALDALAGDYFVPCRLGGAAGSRERARTFRLFQSMQ